MTFDPRRNGRTNRDRRDQAFARSVIAAATKRHNEQRSSMETVTRPDPNHRVAWLPTRPDFAITCHHTLGTSTNRGYHESFYTVVSRREVDADDFKHLDACGLLGMGQAYDVTNHTTLVDEVPPVTYDSRTGAILDIQPMNGYTGQPITNLTKMEYHQYSVRRICDSGD